MLWFIIDSEKAVAVVMDGDRVYAVMDVIKPRHSGINEECDEEDDQDNQDDIYARHMSSRSSGISKRMIDQFFTEEEGPDRDWQKYDDYGLLDEDDLPLELTILQWHASV